LLTGCGTFVPQIGEIWDDERHSAHTLELKVKTQIYCELQSAIRYLNVTYYNGKHPFSQTINGKDTEIIPVPEDWGVTLALYLTVEEQTALNPGVAFNTPMIPGTILFPNKISVPGPQSYSFGLGGTLSADAFRQDKFTFFYLVKDLEGDTPSVCYVKGADHPPGLRDPKDLRDPEDLQGSSLLLESDLGIEKWLQNAMNVRLSVGPSRPAASLTQESFSYDVKFDIVSSGNITPTWKLVRVSTGNGSLPFFNTKRERIHEMQLTFGPTAPAPTGKAVQGKPKGGAVQPGVLSSNDSLALQIGSAVATAVKSALSSQ
jgi:hypothetical protein